MKSVRVAVAAALMSLLVFAVPAAATEPPPDCTEVVDLDVDVAVELHVDGDQPCRPVAGTPCTLHGQPGVFNLRGRCICLPPTTIPTPTVPPTTTPATTTPPTTVVAPVVERTVVAPPATPVRGRPSFTG